MKLVFLALEKDVERRERAVTAGDVLLHLDFLGVGELLVGVDLLFKDAAGPPQHVVLPVHELLGLRPGGLGEREQPLPQRLKGLPHLAAEVFRSRVNADILVVPYRGTGPAINDVVGGQVNMMVVAPLAAIQLVRSGKLRALAITAPRRFEGAPETPTAEEAGMPDFLFLNSYGFWGPKRLPKDIVMRISATMRQASESSDLRRRLLDLGVSAMWETPEVFAGHLSEEFQRNNRILQQAGVKPE